MTERGGSNDKGVLFEYDPVTSTYTKKLDFDGTAKGDRPYGSLVQASNGKLYGLTLSGGANNGGVLFEYDLVTSTYTKKRDLGGTLKGRVPKGSLFQAPSGKLYGMTRFGGKIPPPGLGVMFEYDPVTATYIRKITFNANNGAMPNGNLIQVGSCVPAATCNLSTIDEEGCDIPVAFTDPGDVFTGIEACEAAVTMTSSDTGDTDVCGDGDGADFTRTYTLLYDGVAFMTCNQAITVVDSTLLAITCPPNVTIECGSSTAPGNTGTATGSDGCGTISISFSDISVLGCGNTEILTRVWTSTDQCGNSVSCTQTITVVDTTPPLITCPPSVTVESDLGSCTATGVSLGTPTGSDICGTVSFSNNASGEFPFGDTAVLWTATDECGNTSQCTQIVTVDEINTITTVTVDPTSQQYSDLVDFEAIIQPGYCPGAGLAATKVSFYVRNQKVGTADLNLLGGNLVGSLTAPLLEIPSQPSSGDMAPGVALVTAVFEGINPNYDVVDATTNLTITQEDAIVVYTGHTLQAMPSANASETTVVLSANIQDITITDPDPNAGDIRNAKVMFVNRDSNTAISPWIQVTDLFNPSDPTTGTVSFDWLVNIGNSESKSFTVGIIVGTLDDNGYYLRDSADDITIITVYKPAGDFITGGGYILPDNSAGQYESTPDLKTNFGFNVKYNKRGNRLKGQIKIIFRRLESDGVHTYQFKGNAIQSLGVDVSIEEALFAEFITKGNLTDITDPKNTISLGGNLTLKTDMTDRGELGDEDSIGINLTNNSGILLYSSNWSGISTEEMELAVGVIVVHRGFSSGRTESTTIVKLDSKFKISSDKNPFDAKAFISLDSSDKSSLVTYSVYDTNNKFLYTKRILPNQKFTFGEGLRSGVYLVIVQQGNNIGQIKMIKR